MATRHTPHKAAPSTPTPHPPTRPALHARRPRRPAPPPAALPDILTHVLASVHGGDALLAAVADTAHAAARSAPLAYEPVVLPCHNMGCGDAVYRR